MPRDRRAWLYTVASGVLMVGVFLGCFTEAVIKAGPGNAIVLASTSPFWVAILSRWLYGERLSLTALAGLLIGFGGVVIVFSSQLGAQGSAGRTFAGLALALSASLGWALGTLIVKRQLDCAPARHRSDGRRRRPVHGRERRARGAVDGGRGHRGDALVGAEPVAVGRFHLGRRVGTCDDRLLRRAAGGQRDARDVVVVPSSPVVAILIGAGLGTIPSALALFGMAVTIAGVFIVNLPARRAQTTALRPPEAAVEPAVLSSASSASP